MYIEPVHTIKTPLNTSSTSLLHRLHYPLKKMTSNTWNAEARWAVSCNTPHMGFIASWHSQCPPPRLQQLLATFIQNHLH
uniref:Uncharacterized protein n=1 Tax=Anguilla anguilla TaxID=7936 RepID=A0A0E9X9M4_ANGAN